MKRTKERRADPRRRRPDYSLPRLARLVVREREKVAVAQQKLATARASLRRAKARLVKAREALRDAFSVRKLRRVYVGDFVVVLRRGRRRFEIEDADSPPTDFVYGPMYIRPGQLTPALLDAARQAGVELKLFVWAEGVRDYKRETGSLPPGIVETRGSPFPIVRRIRARREDDDVRP